MQSGRSHRKPNKKHWKSVAVILAALVVFVTTYSLILPALTLETNTAEDEAGLELVLQEDVDADAAAQDYEQPDAEADLPAQTFEEKINKNHTAVRVEAPEGAFPAGTTMKVEDVSTDKEIRAAIEDTVDGQIKTLQALDISFYKDGEMIDPEREIQVSVLSDQFEKNETPEIIHLPEIGGGSRAHRCTR